MSSEQILLMIAFSAALLIHSMLRAVRKRHGGEPAQAQRLPSSPRPPPTRDLQPTQATGERMVSDAMNTPESEEVRKAGRPVAPLTQRTSWRKTAVVSLRDPVGLRRAVVLMTLLDPCRAIEPHT